MASDEEEYKALLSAIQKLGYRQVTGHGWARDGGFIFDLFRGTEVDVDDCLRLIRARGEAFDPEKLKARYQETALYDLNPDKMMKNLDYLLVELKDRK